MAKPVRIGIIRARHDVTMPLIPDPVCLGVLMTGDYAVLRYWENTTRGHLDFVNSTMFPWIDITLGADTDRDVQARVAVDALRAKFPDPDPLAGLDGLIVITYPGFTVMPNPLAGQPGQPVSVTVHFDGGQGGVDGLEAAVIPVANSDHTFICHEVGHVLGFEHSFGLDNNGTDWAPGDANIIVGTEYGSPYDLMSSASFGTRGLGTGPTYFAQPTFVEPPAPGWPTARPFGKGPHVSRANLHLVMPDALAGRLTEAPFPQPGAPVQARLVPVSTSSGTCLLVLHPPNEPANGVGRVYVEFRVAKGWDAGIDPLGPSLSREGVVVHSVADIPNAGPRIFYRGSVPIGSVDTDVAVATTPLVVRVRQVDPDRNWADVTVTTGAARGAEIVRAEHFDTVIGEVGPVHEAQNPCGGRLRQGTFATETFSRFLVRTTGFGSGDPAAAPPTVSWTVGGVPLAAAEGTVDVPVGDVTFAVAFTIRTEPFELLLSSRGGERYETPVAVTVTENATSETAAAVLTAVGWIDGVHPDDLAALGACIAEIANRHRIPPAPFRRPSPEPPWAGLGARRLADALWLDRALRVLEQTPDLAPAGREALRQLLDLQVKPAPTLLDGLRAVGVDFSVPEPDLLDWLGNAEFTPYPAFARALLNLLGGRGLARPVFLDVIAFNYENSPGGPSPRRVEDVDLDLLRAAVVEGSNVRYGEQVTAFGDLLAPR